jgi:hypothetical protein
LDFHDTVFFTPLAPTREERRDGTGFRLEMLSLQGRKTKRARKCSKLFLLIWLAREVGVAARGNTATPTQTRVTLTEENIF